MKKLIYLFLLFTSAALHAQSFDAVIKGSTDSNIPYLLLSRAERNGLKQVMDTIHVKGSNTFKHQVGVSEPTVGFLFHKDKWYTIWLKAGTTTEVSIKDGEPKFSGNGGVYATYFVEDNNFFEKRHKEYERKNEGFKKESNLFSDRYFEIKDSITFERIHFLESYFAGSSSKEHQLIDYQIISLIYSSLYYKLLYEGSDIRRFKFYQRKYNSDLANPYAFSDRVDLKDTLLLSNLYYSKFITQLIANIALDRLKSNGSKFAIEPYVDLAMLTVDELTERAPTNQKFKALLLNKLVDEIKEENKRAWIGKVNATLTGLSDKNGDKDIIFVKEKLNKVAEELKTIKGSPAPAFALKDVNGKSYSLQDFKGKKLYLDLGASWCKPCIEGIPAWNKLVEENAGNKDIVFISLSLDDSKVKWQHWVKKYTPQGLQLYAGEGGFGSKFAKDYNIKAIPRFILLDEEGKIKDFFAPEPKDIRDMLLPK